MGKIKPSPDLSLNYRTIDRWRINLGNIAIKFEVLAKDAQKNGTNLDKVEVLLNDLKKECKKV